MHSTMESAGDEMGIVVDLDSHLIRINGHILSLTRIERRYVECLATRYPDPVYEQNLYVYVWEYIPRYESRSDNIKRRKYDVNRKLAGTGVTIQRSQEHISLESSLPPLFEFSQDGIILRGLGQGAAKHGEGDVLFTGIDLKGTYRNYVANGREPVPIVKVA